MSIPILLSYLQNMNIYCTTMLLERHFNSGSFNSVYPCFVESDMYLTPFDFLNQKKEYTVAWYLNAALPIVHVGTHASRQLPKLCQVCPHRLAPLHDDPNFPKCGSDLQHDKHEPLRAALISVQYWRHSKEHLRSVPYPLTLEVAA